MENAAEACDQHSNTAILQYLRLRRQPWSFFLVHGEHDIVDLGHGERVTHVDRPALLGLLVTDDGDNSRRLGRIGILFQPQQCCFELRQFGALGRVERLVIQTYFSRV
jgi:hypothetical protein